MALFIPNQTVAERVVRDGFKQFERALKRFGISSPATPGVDILSDYGTDLNPELVLSFYTHSGNMTPQASDCYCQDEEKVADAWQAYKTFIRIGGHRITAERRLEQYSAKNRVVTFDDKSAITIINDRASDLPMLAITTWQAGVLDLTDLKQKADFGYYVGERLERIGYRRHSDKMLIDLGEVYRHPDPAMAPVLIDWSDRDMVKMLIFTGDEEALRVQLTPNKLEELAIPVIDMRRKPVAKGLHDNTSDVGRYSNDAEMTLTVTA